MAGLLLLALVGARVYLATPGGQEQTLSTVLEQVNAGIQGKVEAGRLDLSGLRLVLEEVKLHDPEGNLVAEVARVEAAPRLLSLAQRKIDLASAQVIRPRLYLVQDERGLNLSRAIAPKHRREPSGSPSTLELEIERLALKEGHVDFQQRFEGQPERRYTLEDLAAEAFARYTGATGALEASAELTGRSSAPLEAPLSATATLSGEGEALSGQASVSFGAAKLVGRASRNGTEEAALHLDWLELPPEVAKALAPGWPLKQPLAAKGEVVRRGNVAQLELEASSGEAKAIAQGSVDIARWRSDGLKVRLRGVNLAEFFEGGLTSSLSADLSFRGAGTSLENLEGELTLDVPASPVEGQTLGPLHLEASAGEGKLEVSKLHAKLPGVTLNGKGSGTTESIRLTGKIETTDLTAAAKALSAIGVGDVPPLAGTGSFDFVVEGPPDSPGVELSGFVGFLRMSDLEARRVDVAAVVPDVRRPLEAQAQVTVETLRLGESTFRDVEGHLSTSGRELDADLSVKGLADVVAKLTGRLDADGDGILLQTFAVEYPEARWEMKEPAQVSWGEGLTVVEPLTLVSGEQVLSVSARKEGKRLRGTLEASGIDLARLPKALVSSELNLSGRVSGSAKVDGDLPRPEGEVRLELSGGGVKKLTGVAASVEASYRKDRAVGNLTVAATSGSMRGEFDLPVSALMARRPERVHLVLNIGALQVGELLTQLEQRADADGLVTGTVTLDGTAEDPKLTAALEGKSLSYQRPGAPALEAKSAVLKVASGAGSRLGLRLQVEALGGEATLMLDTPLTVSKLVSDPPTKDQLLDTKVGAELELKKLDLAQAAQAGLVRRKITGQLGLRAAASGSANAPEGNAFLTLSGFTAPGVPSSEATVRTVATATGIEASAEAKRNGHRVLLVKAKLGAPLREALDLDALAKATLEAEAEVGPIAFKEVIPQSAPEEEEEGTARPEDLAGVAEGRFEVSGTLAAPRLKARATATQLMLGKTPLGKARVVYDYAATKNGATLEFVSAGGGGLNAKAAATLELSLPALRDGLAWKAAPLEVGVKADRFDLAFLSGLTPTVRTLGGKLRADATVSGSYASPDFRGTLEWNDGRIGLLGYGEYRKIHLLLDATADRFQLKDLAVQSGGGTLQASADAVRSRGVFRLKGSAEAKRFPIVSDDQLFAIASLRSSFVGDLTARRLDIRGLEIPEAHIDLPEVKRKDLQSLDRPKDIVLTRNGQPLTRPKKKAPANGTQAESSPRQEPSFAYAVVVDAPRNLWVKGSDVQVELGLSEGFRIEGARQTQIFGEVRVLRGRADVIGRRFDIQKDSQLRFAGPAAAPYININATYVSEREGVTVNVAISGRGKDVTLKPTSQPPLAESEIYTLLATGRRTLKRGSGATITGAQAASVVGSLAASQLRSLIATKLPLDVFSIEAGEEGLAGTRVEAGTYLSDKLYLGYTGEIGADASKGENSHEVKLEYQISPRWSFEAKYGDANAGGADLIWSKDY